MIYALCLMFSMFNFLHSFLPSPILLDLGIIKIHWYGLLIAAAVFFCLWLALRLSKKALLPEDHIFNLAFYLVLFGLIGARLWHALFYNFSYFSAQPLDIFKVWQGGLAIHGAILAGLITLIVYCRKHHLFFWGVSDILAVVLPLGQAIGRVGNYFNQELFGLPCNYQWCIPITPANRPDQYLGFAYFQPVFLYESLLDFILFAVLLGLFKFKKIIPGQLTLFYLGGYAVIRFFTEFWRWDSARPGILSWVQWLCLVVMLAVSLGLVKRNKMHYN